MRTFRSRGRRECAATLHCDRVTLLPRQNLRSSLRAVAIAIAAGNSEEQQRSSKYVWQYDRSSS